MDEEKLPFCECGECGQRVTKPGNRYIHGHNIRGKWGWNTGLTKETDPRVAAQAEKLMGRTKETHLGVAAQSRKMLGRTKETHSGVAAHARALKGRTKETDPSVARQAEKMQGRKCGPHSDEWNKKIGKGNKGKVRSDEYRRRKSEWMLELLKDPEFKENLLSCLRKGCKVKPTKPEKQLDKLLQKLFPNQWKYVGDYQFTLGGHCPDFININGQKKIIEHFGIYWHGEEKTGVPNEQHEQDKINHFAQFGYQTLIIWEHELGNTKLLEKKIIGFCNERTY